MHISAGRLRAWRRPGRSRLSVGGFAILIALGLAAAGCSGESAPTSQGSGSAPAVDFSQHGPITMAIGKDVTGLRPKEIAEWNKAHPDEKVTLRELPESADQQRAQLLQNAQLKNPDVTIVRLDAVWTAEFAANSWVVPIPDGTVDTSGYLPQTMETVRYFGKNYAVPDATGGGLLFYRTDLLKAAGVAQPPTTWAELKAACVKIKKLPGNAKLGCYAGQFQKYEGLTVNFSEAVNSAGGQVIGKDGKPALNTPEAKAGLDFLVSSLSDGTIPKEAITWQEEQGRQAFQSGNLIFLRNWAYVYASAEKTDGSSKVAGKVGAAPLPGLNGPGVSTLGGNNFAISTFGTNKGTAVDLIKWLNRPAEQKVRMLKTSSPPPLRSVYSDPDVLKAAPYMKALQSSIEKAQPRPVVVRYGDLTLAIQDAAYNALQGQQPTDQALNDLQAKLDSITR